MRAVKAFGVVLLLLAAFMRPLAAQGLEAGSQGRIEFQSFTPKTMFDLARERRQNWPAQKVWGELSFPSDAAAGDKLPVVVLMHGSGGVGKSMNQWVGAFHDIGVATFIVDSFGPRSIVSMVADQGQLSTAANLMDALQALQLLATHPHRCEPHRRDGLFQGG